jgi:DNA repair exonuclease SbcCD ATPase subunit
VSGQSWQDFVRKTAGLDKDKSSKVIMVSQGQFQKVVYQKKKPRSVASGL